jgi:DNA-binding CsgD family transcriptional regulator
VPIWWRGDVIAVNVTFTGQGGHFSAREVDDLEALTQTAAAAIIESGRREASPAGEIRRRFGGAPTVVTEVGLVRPVSPELARAAADLVAAAAQRRPHPRLHVAIVYRPHGLRVLVHDETAGLPAGEPDPLGMGATTWDELLRRAGGGVTVEEVRGWGVLVRADLPYALSAETPPGPNGDGRADTRSSAGRSAESVGFTPYRKAPFTPRESEVLALLRQGLTDREIAARLVVSAKTVEKHVGAIMRKTKTTNRTAAVLTALRNDW